uniref:protein PLASTID MOVEMENT IMPAIRED 1-RELATED 1 n=1 Tax=Erigeron canadensis TaxID=72917 RepID=UPI001CB8BA53|nr:protein PLASTID MOVEMENT IMPAIRED 1-RELATED 1 [Erigeron canadensis]
MSRNHKVNNPTSGEGSGNNHNKTSSFNDDIDVLSKVLYHDDNNKTPTTHPRIGSNSMTRSKSVSRPNTKPNSKISSNEDRFLKDKKSLWSWNTLKSLTHVRNKRFNCCFSLQVHSIEGLPPSFDNLKICVKWKRRDGELTTGPVPVVQGVAEFEELLTNTCSVYGSRSGPHHSAKYEAKHFLLYASLFGDPELDLGKHRVDLTRLLPLTLEELEDEKNSGKWTTTYRLSGKAKGAIMNVSFGYSVVVGNNNSVGMAKYPAKASSIRRGDSLPVSARSVEDIKDLHEVLPISKSDLSESVSTLYKKLEQEKSDDLHEVLPISNSELSESVSMLYKKLEEDKSILSVDYESQRDVQVVPHEPPNPDSNTPDPDYSNMISEFSVLDQGIEFPSKDYVKPEHDIKASDKEGSLKVFDGSDYESLKINVTDSKIECDITESGTRGQDCGDKELLLQELELALNNVLDLKEESDSQEEGQNLKEYDNAVCSDESGFGYGESQNFDQGEYTELKVGYKKKGKSLKLDCAAEAVADDFLNMLGIEHSPFGFSSESESNSPRERLLRQFEKDALANSSSLFNFNIDDDDEPGFMSDPPSASMWGLMPEGPSKTKASILEDMETEALMREWGLNEKVFQRSPSSISGGSGVDLSPEVPLELPPLGEGLGPFVQTNNGGFLRSMNPEIFKNAKSGGNLIMQVSSPVVVPAEMGSGIMDVLQCLASVGIEKLSVQANKLMPLEDISGKTIQQIAWESTPSLEGPHTQDSLQQEPVHGQFAADHSNLQSSGRRSRKYDLGAVDPEYVSLEDLAPLAMNKIEALSMEGLRIQSGMSDNDAPSNISPQSINEVSALEGKRVNLDGSLGLEGTGGLQLLDVKHSTVSDGHDDEMDGIMGLSVTLDEWMKLDSGELGDGDEISERTSRILAAHHASDLMRARRGKGKGSKRGGLLGNNFTVALMVQLRDPLRNFEPVGTPMLALVQVERVFVPPKPKIYSSIFSLWNKPEEENEATVEEKKVTVEVKEASVEEETVNVDENVLVPQFKITEVHVAGVKTEPEPSKKQIWGSNAKQQQAGSRWLVANGMGKKNAKHPLMKSKPVAASGKSSGSLWSISSKGKGSVKVDTPVRNPNVIIPNETVKLLSGAGFV